MKKQFFGCQYTMLFIAFFVGVASFLTASPPTEYRHFITSIEASKKPDRYVVSLSDGSQWEVCNKRNDWTGWWKGKQFENVPLNAEVFIGPGKTSSFPFSDFNLYFGFSMELFNPEAQESQKFLARLIQKTNFLTIVSKNKKSTQQEAFTPANWAEYPSYFIKTCSNSIQYWLNPEYIDVWELSDGSKWEIPYQWFSQTEDFSTREGWEEGDRVFVSLDPSGTTFLMFDIDREIQVKVTNRYGLSTCYYHGPMLYVAPLGSLMP